MRPKQLDRCIRSVQNQTDKDFEQLFINDDEGKGLFWANSQIHENRHRITGKWVYVLDDDDFLIDMSFIEGLKKIDKENDVNLVICKGFIGDKFYPTEGYWRRKPLRGTVGSPNFITRTDHFLNYSQKWCKDKAGDFFFIKAAYNHGKTFWWNREVFQAPIGNGLPE